MNLREYIEELNAFVEANPDSLNMTVIASSDDEGYYCRKVNFSPCKGFYDRGDFYPSRDFYDNGYEESKINAVCIN